MAKTEISEGQALVNRIIAYITRYVVLPDDVAQGNQAIVLALWALHTWVFDRFHMTPPLALTASVKEAGKTLCMEVLLKICRGSEQLATLRPLAMLRLIREHGGHATLGIDEAEKLSSAAVGDLRSIFTTGCYKGGFHVITKGEETTRFQTFCPKLFALIGDVMDVVRSRSITVHLDRGIPVGDFRGMDADEGAIEAEEIVSDIERVFAAIPQMPLVQPAHMAGREVEIWRPLFSLASALALDVETVRKLTAASVDLANLKKLPPRRFFDQAQEDNAALARDAERAIKDLAAVLNDPDSKQTGHIWSGVAVERMRGIPTGPWRTYRGVGLDADMLAGLVKSFGVHTKVIPMTKGRNAKKLNGYSRHDVLASVPKDDGGKR